MNEISKEDVNEIVISEITDRLEFICNQTMDKDGLDGVKNNVLITIGEMCGITDLRRRFIEKIMVDELKKN